MSILTAWDGAPTEEESRDWTPGEWEHYLREVFAGIRSDWAERSAHDQQGYLAHEAGTPECVALGHTPNPSDPDDWEDDLHEVGWDGYVLCPATRFDTACTACEGECNLPPLPDLWRLPGVAPKAPVSGGVD